jgi:surface protein
MFYNCKNIKKIDLSSFDIKNNTNIKNMFLNCDNLKEIKVSKECLDKINQANPLHKQIIKEIEIYPLCSVALANLTFL